MTEPLSPAAQAVLDAASDSLDRARALLDQPVPEGPTDEELEEEFGAALLKLSGDSMNATAVAFARAVLARWGRPTHQPVAVSERLPGPEDCDAEGLCWWWDPECEQTEGWIRGLPEYCNNNRSHWLPAHALPTPEAL